MRQASHGIQRMVFLLVMGGGLAVMVFLVQRSSLVGSDPEGEALPSIETTGLANDILESGTQEDEDATLRNIEPVVSDVRGDQLPSDVTASDAERPVEESVPVTRPVRFANEVEIRRTLLEAQAILFDDRLSTERYERKVLELEALMAESIDQPTDLLAVIEETFSAVDVHDPEFQILQARMLEEVEKSLGYLWAQSDPEGSLLYARDNAQENLLTGWITSQMLADNSYEPILERLGVEPTEEVMWDAILDVARTDTVSSLNQIMESHMDLMEPARWREILFNGHNSSDSVLASWFSDNTEALQEFDTYDEVEVIRMLRRLDPGSGPFMISDDLARVDEAVLEEDYAAVGDLFLELSTLYDNTIDASAVGDLPLDWAREDFLAASEWLLEHAEKFSEPEVLESLISSVYRTGVLSGEAAEEVLSTAMAIEDETYRGMALSNVLIPQMEEEGIQLETTWVSNLDPGFAKQRTMAGYVLGLSRHSSEPTLEAQVKFQFLKDEFDLEEIKHLVEDSELSDEEKTTTLTFLETY